MHSTIYTKKSDIFAVSLIELLRVTLLHEEYTSKKIALLATSYYPELQNFVPLYGKNTFQN
jgi:hypothetical protein